MKSICTLFALAVLASTAWGQAAAPPQVQVSEVLRRGDLVTVMGEGPRANADDAFAAAMAPPADDSHLWTVTVWTTPNCAACEKLKADFRKAPELLAFVAAPAPALPWAHYVEYSGADETQKDRRDKYKVSRYPTIVVQPPRNKMWGDPGLVVFYDNSGYADPKTLATKMQKAVRKFADVQGRKGYPKLTLATPVEPSPQAMLEPVWNLSTLSAFPAAGVEGAGQAIGVNPPFLTPAKPDPFNPNSVPSPNSQPTQFPPQADPAQAPSVMQLLSLIGSLFGFVLPSSATMAALLLAVQTGLWIWEIRAKKTPAKWDDDAIAFVHSLIDKTQPPKLQDMDPSAKP